MAVVRWAIVAALFSALVAPTAQAQVVMHTVTVTTDASGNVTAYTAPTFGLVRAVRYVPDGSSPLDTGADITISDNASGHELLVWTNVGPSARDAHPRAFTVTTTGTTAVYAAAGEAVRSELPVAGAIKVVVAQGGNAKSGTLYLWVQGR